MVGRSILSQNVSSIIPYSTLYYSSKFAATVCGTILERIISSFILLLSNIRRLFIGIDSFIRIQTIYPMLHNIILTK